MIRFQRFKRHAIAAIISLILIATNSLSCNAKVINAEASSSYTAKVRAGLAQSAQWLSQYIVGTHNVRSPRKVKLALVGLGRTGSTSFSAALKQLGYAPIHDDEAQEVSDIYASMMDESMNMDEVNVALGERGFDAPMVSTREYVRWAATAPDVKVILTVRDKSKWARSWLSVVPVAFLLNQRPFCWIKSAQELAALNTEIMLNIPTNGHPELYDDIPTLEDGFEAWTNFVRDTVPPEKLLEFDVRQGWVPLCKFLGDSVPEGKFPHINDRVVVDVIVKVFIAVTWVWPLIVALPILAAYFLVRRCLLKGTEKDKIN
eukprot:CAMPEP_0196130150 /NCGR_PEP_ID=MMETSP0910-20130528/614_1 /TAXON_ID=49265 /ORGANISM="Thalassiosira rotula, Strain GSO102" /LENGTH=316 /DNA_ID=CAMNT_0041389389 /DNA_START=46 /DNA_END=996 /DNA_ORIENTATION=-